MSRLGVTLIDRGYRILPIQPKTKRPGLYRRGAWRNYPRWSRHCERPTTEVELEIWSEWPEAGVGVVTGDVIGIDIDVLEPAHLAHEIEALAKRMLGDTPAVRIGCAPKRLLVYRATEPFAGFKHSPIEVLGLGQQFVAYGIHPVTDKPYDWPVVTLADLDVAELPAVSEAKVREFVRSAYALLPDTLRVKNVTETIKDEPAQPESLAQRGNYPAVEDALRHIENADLHYDSWVRIGMAIKGALGQEGAALFEQWSATSTKNDPGTTRACWASFAPSRIGAGTIYQCALERGWHPPADLRFQEERDPSEPHPAGALLATLRGTELASLPDTPATPPPSPRPLPAGWDQVGGVLADMMTLMGATAKRPQPVLALGASLCAVGALMGRKYRTESNTRSNLYVVGIAESGAGKNHSRVVINELFRRANLLQYLGGNKIASGSGLLTAIQRQPAILFQLDEFGMFLSAAADRKRSPRYICEILDLMTELYTTAGTTYFGIEYASSQQNNAYRAIHQPCVSIYGTTTPLHFWQALQASNIADGSLARFLILESEDDFPDSNESFGVIDPSDDLIERLQLIHQGGGRIGGNLANVASIQEVGINARVVVMTSDARDAFRVLDKTLVARLRRSRGSGFSSILARIEENATKLALIRAVSRHPVDPLIEREDAEWGIALSQHCAELTIREASARISENQVESHHKRALQILRDAGESGMSRSEFTRRTQFMDHRQREGVLRTLAEARFVEQVTRPSGGRPAQWIKML